MLIGAARSRPFSFFACTMEKEIVTVALDAPKSIAPLRQGDLSNLCGVYSHLNAIRLCHFPFELTHEQLRNLYEAGIDELAKKYLPGYLNHGIDELTWLKVGHAIVNECNERYGTTLIFKKIEIGPRPSLSRFLREGRKAIGAGEPVLVRLGKKHDHFTVVSGISPHRIRLFDSSAMRWLPKASTTFTSASSQRHILSPSSIFRLVDDW